MHYIIKNKVWGFLGELLDISWFPSFTESPDIFQFMGGGRGGKESLVKIMENN